MAARRMKRQGPFFHVILMWLFILAGWLFFGALAWYFYYRVAFSRNLVWTTEKGLLVAFGLGAFFALAAAIGRRWGHALAGLAMICLFALVAYLGWHGYFNALDPNVNSMIERYREYVIVGEVSTGENAIRLTAEQLAEECDRLGVAEFLKKYDEANLEITGVVSGKPVKNKLTNLLEVPMWGNKNRGLNFTFFSSDQYSRVEALEPKQLVAIRGRIAKFSQHIRVRYAYLVSVQPNRYDPGGETP